MAQELDKIDLQILKILQENGRITNLQLSNEIGLSPAPTLERVRKLEIAGVIKAYRAEIDLSRLGYGIRALVRVGRAEYARVVKLIEQTPEVINAFNVTGEDSWVLEIAVIDVAHLDAVVSKFCLLADTSTSIVLNAPRENAPVLPARQENVRPAAHRLIAR